MNTQSQFEFDAFLSFNSHNLNIAEELYEHLTNAGLKIFFTKKIKAPTTNAEKLDNGLKNSKALLLLISKDGFGQYQEDEYNTFYDIYVKARKTRPIYVISVDNKIDSILDNQENTLYPQKIKGTERYHTNNENEINSIITDLGGEQHARYVGENKEGEKKGLGEIDFYWGDRLDANEHIKKYLVETKTNRIFIAALGFGTLKVLKTPEVIEKFSTKIKKGEKFKIIIVKPISGEELINYRGANTKPEILRQNFNDGETMIREFIEELADKSFELFSNTEQNRKIAGYIEFRKYTEKCFPRHFILKGNDDIIFVGSYLSHTEGKKSYLMKLMPCAELNLANPEDQNKHYRTGLFNLFDEEAQYIYNNSKIISSQTI
jgi:hypothetical protein